MIVIKCVFIGTSGNTRNRIACIYVYKFIVNTKMAATYKFVLKWRVNETFFSVFSIATTQKKVTTWKKCEGSIEIVLFITNFEPSDRISLTKDRNRDRSQSREGLGQGLNEIFEEIPIKGSFQKVSLVLRYKNKFFLQNMSNHTF